MIQYYETSTTTPSATYAATSGNFGPNGIDYRNSMYQNQRDLGPVPEGLNSVNLTLDPNRVTPQPGIVGNEGLLYSAFGIQKIPQSWTSPTTGLNYTFPGWGTQWARLRIISEGLGRDNFYLHDSHKDYSHGCIEVNPGVFTKLIQLRSAGKTAVGVRVKYSGNNISTAGATYY